MSQQLARDFVPVPAAGVVTRVLDGERLLWHEGYVRRLDRVASVVWAILDGHSTVADLSQDLAAGFGARPPQVEVDVLALCATLQAEGYLVGEGSGRSRPAPGPLSGVRGVRAGRGQLGSGLGSLGRVAWVHRTGRFRVLDHDFAVRSTDPHLAGPVEQRLGAFAAQGTPARLYSVVGPTTNGRARYEVYLDDTAIFSAPDRDTVVRRLVAHADVEAIKCAHRHVIVHAGGVTAGGLAVVLPGTSNAGKTTLVAGLVVDGFSYLTDDMVTLELGSGLVQPYARTLNLRRGSWKLLPGLGPPDVGPGRRSKQRWAVDVRSIRPDAIAKPAPIGSVIALRFEPGAAPSLEPISRAEAVCTLHGHALNARSHGEAAFTALVDSVAHASCAHLVTGELAGAVSLVRRLAEARAHPNGHAEC